MKSKLLIYPIALIGALLLSGCASSGLFFSMNNTAVELSENNYEIVATNVSGEAEAGYILGLSFSAGAATNTLALALAVLIGTRFDIYFGCHNTTQVIGLGKIPKFVHASQGPQC